MNSVIMGIDPGRDSGSFTVMPLTKDPLPNEIIVFPLKNKTIYEFIDQLKMYRPKKVFLEKVFKNAKLIEHRAEVSGVLATLKITHESVEWSQWKKALNVPIGKVITSKGAEKRTANRKRRDELDVATRLFPVDEVEGLTQTTAASLLIAEYGRRLMV